MTSNEIAQRLYQCESHGASWEEFARDLAKILNQPLPHKDLYDKRQALRLVDELRTEIEDL